MGQKNNMKIVIASETTQSLKKKVEIAALPSDACLHATHGQAYNDLL